MWPLAPPLARSVGGLSSRAPLPVLATAAPSSTGAPARNRSWFATSYPRSRFTPEAGYVAPPLDGIWATAPYLHNGSVPTVADLLNSYDRPDEWARYSPSGKTPTGAADEYDHERLGWRVRRGGDAGGKYAYDTAKPGYGNGGHTYGDHLTDEERAGVVEYLKTL